MVIEKEGGSKQLIIEKSLKIDGKSDTKGNLTAELKGLKKTKHDCNTPTRRRLHT